MQNATLQDLVDEFCRLQAADDRGPRYLGLEAELERRGYWIDGEDER